MRFLYPLLTLMLLAVTGQSVAQQYNSFRFVGEISPVSNGAVTSIELSPESSTDEATARLSFLNAAGLSSVYNINFSSSGVISDSIPVFMPSADFGATANSGLDPLDLDGVEFLTGKLTDPDNENAILPLHWFRMTLHNDIWSGVFRVADRVYSITRNDNGVVDVRTASSRTTFQPPRQVKVTAVIDNDFVFSNEDNQGHINALESIHVMEGLTADSLGISVKLDQLVYRTAAELTTGSNNLSSATRWLDANAEAFGISDNFATFFFRGAADVQSETSGNVVLQGQPVSHQFDSAYLLGQLLGLPQHSNTLNSSDQAQSVNAAYWNSDQRDYLNDNPPPEALTQLLSFDEPEIAVTVTEERDIIPQEILDSESVESVDGLGFQNDNTGGTGNTTNPGSDNGDVSSGGSSGGGALDCQQLLLLLLGSFALLRRQRNGLVYNR